MSLESLCSSLGNVITVSVYGWWPEGFLPKIFCFWTPTKPVQMDHDEFNGDAFLSIKWEYDQIFQCFKVKTQSGINPKVRETPKPKLFGVRSSNRWSFYRKSWNVWVLNMHKTCVTLQNLNWAVREVGRKTDLSFFLFIFYYFMSWDDSWLKSVKKSKEWVFWC